MENENNINTAAASLVEALKNAAAGAIDEKRVEEIAGTVAARKFAAVIPALVEKCASAAAEKVEAERMAAFAPVRVEVVAANGETHDCGIQHERFPELFRLCQVRINGIVPNIYLYGPAGSGKSTAARNVAAALGLDFRATGAVYSKYDLLGHMSPDGNYIESDFYRIYKNGGVFLFDEIDISDPRAVKCFALALANGHMAFPCGLVERNKDCIIIAGGNTDMRGGGVGAGFNTGAKQDSAIRDRFVYLYWGLDEKLEMAIADGFGTTGREWCERVRRMRANAVAAGIKDFEITPRATLNGCAMLAAGFPIDMVVDSCVRKGVNDSEWAKISK